MLKCFNLFVFLFLMLVAFSSCNFLFNSQSPSENNSDCAVPPSQSKLFNRIPTFAVPGSSDVDEAAFILGQLKDKLNNDSIKVGKSAHHGYTEIVVLDSPDNQGREKITCLLREVFEENDVNSIYLVFHGWEEMSNEDSRTEERKQVVVEELVIE